jgi:hypothetical protein
MVVAGRSPGRSGADRSDARRAIKAAPWGEAIGEKLAVMLLGQSRGRARYRREFDRHEVGALVKELEDGMLGVVPTPPR